MVLFFLGAGYPELDLLVVVDTPAGAPAQTQHRDTILPGPCASLGVHIPLTAMQDTMGGEQKCVLWHEKFHQSSSRKESKMISKKEKRKLSSNYNPTIALCFGWLSYNNELHVLVLSPALCPLSQCPLHHLSYSFIFTRLSFSLFIWLSDIYHTRNVHFPTDMWVMMDSRSNLAIEARIKFESSTEGIHMNANIANPISSFISIHLTYHGCAQYNHNLQSIL